MKAAVWDGNGSIEVVDRALPALETGWVRLEVASCGICGSDLHDYRRRAGVTGRTPGHEVAGYVSDAGEPTLPAGTLAALEPIESCGHCVCCRSGHYNRCAALELFGIDRSGGFAQYVDVPAERLHPLSAHLDVGVAALAEPLAVAVRAVRLARMDLGARVAVLGGGTIGLLSVAAARTAGAGSIHVTARHPHQAETARALGADETFSDIDAMHAAVGERAYDVVLETVGGHAPTIREAVRVADAGGVIVMVGVFDDETPLPAPEIPGQGADSRRVELLRARRGPQRLRSRGGDARLDAGQVRSTPDPPLPPRRDPAGLRHRDGQVDGSDQGPDSAGLSLRRSRAGAIDPADLGPGPVTRGGSYGILSRYSTCGSTAQRSSRLLTKARERYFIKLI